MFDFCHDYGYQAQKVAEAHLDLVQQWMEFHDEGGAEQGMEEPLEADPAVGPYCGCRTCDVREILAVAWPIIEAGVRSGDFETKPPPYGPECVSCKDYTVMMVPSGGDYVCPRCGASCGSS